MDWENYEAARRAFVESLHEGKILLESVGILASKVCETCGQPEVFAENHAAKSREITNLREKIVDQEKDLNFVVHQRDKAREEVAAFKDLLNAREERISVLRGERNTLAACDGDLREALDACREALDLCKGERHEAFGQRDTLRAILQDIAGVFTHGDAAVTATREGEQLQKIMHERDEARARIEELTRGSESAKSLGPCETCGEPATQQMCDIRELHSWGPDRRFEPMPDTHLYCAEHERESVIYEMDPMSGGLRPWRGGK